jgi:transposase
MFFRSKKSGNRTYLRIVESYRDPGQVKQRVIATLGRLEHLQEKGGLESLLQSGARFTEELLLLSAHREGELPEVRSQRIGPVPIFERLWRESGCQAVIEQLLQERQFGFAVERAVFLTVPHRLLVSGSDRSAHRWIEGYAVEGVDGLQLHHAYRAMGWLGEALAKEEQEGATPFSPRCTKDRIEEALFIRNRDLFSELEMVFFDTTSIYFEGEGGKDLGRYGHSKDHRPDRKQVVVGAVLDQRGRPLCCEIRPGNTSDVTSFIPIAHRLQRRFGVERICLVADRGMISKGTMEQLESEGWQYILGARMRRRKEVSEAVLSRAGRYHEVRPEGQKSDAPAPLQVKEVRVGEHRYIVCRNEARARKDQADREAIPEGLRKKLKQGDKALVGNKGYRKYPKGKGANFSIDPDKIAAEARFDGKWVLRTNTELPAEEVALKYKWLRQVEAFFRSTKSLLDTRPIFHHCDETIRGHPFCSFLALVLRHQLQQKLNRASLELEWEEVVRDLDALEEVEVIQQEKRFILRTSLQGCAGKVFRAVGVKVPKMVRACAITANR